MINAYDWFESFAQAMRGEQKVDGKGDDAMDVDGEEDDDDDDERRKEIQARFLMSAHELDWLGFLKATGRKKDHLARTMFDPPPSSA